MESQDHSAPHQASKPAPSVSAKSECAGRDSQLRGLELMAQRDDLVFYAAHAFGPEAKAGAIAALDAWDSARTEEDWEAIRVATYGMGKARRLRLVQVLEDVSPIGQRR